MNGMRLKDQPASERPRERLVTLGADALSHAELVGILLRTGLRGTFFVHFPLAVIQSCLYDRPATQGSTRQRTSA